MFFSATRADYWPLEPVLRAAAADARLEPVLLVTGTHHSADHGATAGHIDLADVVVDHRPLNLRRGTGARHVAHLAAATLEATAAALDDHHPHLAVLLGDRAELVAAAVAATIARVPIVHLCGGEHTAGAIDDALRHAVTKLAHLHCCATPGYARRLAALGEAPWRIHVTGSPAIDRLLPMAEGATLDRLERLIGRPLPRPVGLVTYHPPTACPDRLDAELTAIRHACRRLRSVIVTASGLDVSADRVTGQLHAWARSRDGVAVVPSLGPAYPVALATVDVVVGNSSSGVLEAPSFGVPVVDVGNRQQGRDRAECVISVPGADDDVDAALARALDPGFRASVAGRPNPHGDGKAAARIVDVLAGAPLDRLLVKEAP